jgi:hypothetical protein
MTATSRAVALLAVIALGLSAPSWADEKENLMKPGKEHKILSTLAGTYHAKVKDYFDSSKGPVESTGIAKRKMIMGGRFLEELYEGKAMGQKFYGLGINGYDDHKKKYTGVWIDSMTNATNISYGTYDADKKTFTYLAEDFDPFLGKKMKSRSVLRILSDSEEELEMYRSPIEGGKEEKVLEIHYTRK